MRQKNFGECACCMVQFDFLCVFFLVCLLEHFIVVVHLVLHQFNAFYCCFVFNFVLFNEISVFNNKKKQHLWRSRNLFLFTSWIHSIVFLYLDFQFSLLFTIRWIFGNKCGTNFHIASLFWKQTHFFVLADSRSATLIKWIRYRCRNTFFAR